MLKFQVQGPLAMCILFDSSMNTMQLKVLKLNLNTHKKLIFTDKNKNCLFKL